MPIFERKEGLIIAFGPLSGQVLRPHVYGDFAKIASPIFKPASIRERRHRKEKFKSVYEIRLLYHDNHFLHIAMQKFHLKKNRLLA